MDILCKSVDSTPQNSGKIVPPRFFFSFSLRTHTDAIFINMIFKSNLGNQEAFNTKRIDSK